MNEIDRLFHALGDPTRRSIVEALGAGPCSVSRLAEPLDMSLAAVVQHLRILEESGLIQTQKTGRVRTCALNPKALKLLANWIADRRPVEERRLDRLGDLLGGLFG
jgi:DNA-binding transcriptional ArsR family regulator